MKRKSFLHTKKMSQIRNCPPTTCKICAQSNVPRNVAFETELFVESGSLLNKKWKRVWCRFDGEHMVCLTMFFFYGCTIWQLVVFPYRFITKQRLAAQILATTVRHVNWSTVYILATLKQRRKIIKITLHHMVTKTTVKQSISKAVMLLV